MSRPLFEPYAEAFAALSPEMIGRLKPLVSEDVRFKDPFNDIRGWPALEAM